MDTENKLTIKLVTPITLIIFILFFLAKIFDKIDWSWWWVFSPLWVPFAFVLLIIIGWILAIFITTLIDYLYDKRS